MKCTVTIPRDHVQAQVSVTGLESVSGRVTWTKGATIPTTARGLVAACSDAGVAHLLVTRLQQQTGQPVRIDGGRLVAGEGDDAKPLSLGKTEMARLAEWLQDVLPQESRRMELTDKDARDLHACGLTVEAVPEGKKTVKTETDRDEE